MCAQCGQQSYQQAPAHFALVRLKCNLGLFASSIMRLGRFAPKMQVAIFLSQGRGKKYENGPNLDVALSALQLGKTGEEVSVT